MIKASKCLLIVAVLLSYVAVSASAAGVCAGGTTAMSQLLSAAPGGPDALNEIIVASPAPNLVPRSSLTDALAYNTAAADSLIKGLAASARTAGKTKTASLLIRLLNEGTPAEKLQLMSATSKPYSFPSRFTLAVTTGGVCRTVAELFCRLSCIHTGTAQEQCKEDCRTIFVTSCD